MEASAVVSSKRPMHPRASDSRPPACTPDRLRSGPAPAWRAYTRQSQQNGEKDHAYKRLSNIPWSKRWPLKRAFRLQRDRAFCTATEKNGNANRNTGFKGLRMTKIPTKGPSTPGRKPVIDLSGAYPTPSTPPFRPRHARPAKSLSQPGRRRPLPQGAARGTGPHVCRQPSGVVRGAVPQLVELDSLIARRPAALCPSLPGPGTGPGNVGTLARTQLAIGGAGLLFPSDRTRPSWPGCAKAAAGALDRLPLIQGVNLARALTPARCGPVIKAPQPAREHGSLLRQARFPCGAGFGYEDKGMRRTLQALFSMLSIPMAGASIP
jgi:23S rRNA (guanosine2251-2'-O)-methyltransferase